MDTFNPRYRIQAVSDQTGLSTATLRAWERRYGFPAPQRTSSAYRLYSDHDVELVRRMQKLVDTGVAPGQAAQQILADTDALDLPPESEDPYDIAVHRIVDAVERFELTTLQQELRRALLLDSAVVVFERILRPALVSIGHQWHVGRISIAQEHVASNLIASTMSDLLRLTSAPPDAPIMLLGCFAEELHVMPLLGAALQVASLGFRPVLLGQRTPPAAIARAMDALAPRAIGLSVTVAPEPASTARELVDAYADVCGSTPWLVGGAAAPTLASWIEARGGIVAAPGSAGIKAALAAIPTRAAPQARPAPVGKRR